MTLESARFGRSFTPHVKIKLDGDVHKAKKVLDALSVWCEARDNEESGRISKAQQRHGVRRRQLRLDTRYRYQHVRKYYFSAQEQNIYGGTAFPCGVDSESKVKAPEEMVTVTVFLLGNE